jgi:crotonobetaine/carnitine-CoA ligase
MKDYKLEERTLGSILEDQARANGNAVFLRFRHEQISYHDFNTKVNRVANSLLKLGVSTGDKIAILMPNCPQFMYAWFAVAKIGGIAVPINTAYKWDMLRYALQKCDARVLIIGSQFLEQLLPIEQGLTRLERLIIYDEGGQHQATRTKFEHLAYDDLLNSPATRIETEVAFSDPMAIIFTSGTTGPSKAVLRSHHQFYCIASHCVRIMRATSEDILYTCLPLCHGTAHTFTALSALLCGAQFALGERFSASAFWHEVRDYKATAFSAAGTLLTMLHRQPLQPEDADNTIRVIPSASSIDPEVHRDFERRFQVKVIELYGLTEVGIVISNWPDDERPGSCGKALPEYEVKIFDDDDNEVGPNTVGEIVVRPRKPWFTMLGYYNDPEGTLQVYRNLWFHTGDIARCDEDGYFHFVDRKKDAIRRRGENISAFEVERVVNSHPAVLESAAVPVPSELGEDEVKIVVVLKKGVTLRPEELVAFCDERLPYFAVPTYVQFKEALPKTTNERVQKHVLREEGVTSDTWAIN